MTKLRKRVIIACIAVVVILSDFLIVNIIAQRLFKRDARAEMELYASIRTVEFNASMTQQLTLVRQMVKTPAIIEFLEDPDDEAKKNAAFVDFRA
ncbi:MAG: hypothetical protein II811_04965, partial [Spirochaetaceae bacterium]|nr:hypothetical protein [Spirochaetaceae bacterium]